MYTILRVVLLLIAVVYIYVAIWCFLDDGSINLPPSHLYICKKTLLVLLIAVLYIYVAIWCFLDDGSINLLTGKKLKLSLKQ